MTQALFLLLLAIAVEIFSTTFLKKTNGFRNIKPTVIVLAGYFTAFYLLSLVVKTIPVGIAYALWCGLGIVGTSVVAYFVYKQKLNRNTIIGISLILIGTIIMKVYT